MSGCSWGRSDAKRVGTSTGKAGPPWTRCSNGIPVICALGGGNKKKGLRVVREAASSDGEFFERAEATFALWDMQVRERELVEAVVTARQLARDFPDNRELTRFLHAQQESKSGDGR